MKMYAYYKNTHKVIGAEEENGALKKLTAANGKRLSVASNGFVFVLLLFFSP